MSVRCASRVLLALSCLFALPSAADPGFSSCVTELRRTAPQQGLTREGFDRHLAGIEPDLSVLELLDHQPEFRTPIWDYLSGLVDEERVEDGRTQREAWSDVLERIERQYGVDAATVVAVWGVESNYGRVFGKRPLLVSLATLSCHGRRQPFFRSELFALLQILEEGHISAEGLVGSWAGAFGHTQFMPSTYRRLAVDFDGDGRRDLVSSIPDALASTANFLQRAGWRSGEPWGFEVRVPAGFEPSTSGRRNKQPISAWAARGLLRADGSPLVSGDLSGKLSASSPAGLIRPAGAEGPAFLVLRNFDALFSYNAAESYALAIAHLSDRMRGGGDFRTPWPTDDPGLSRAERREVQQRLQDLGHDIGEIDGIIGSRSRTAIQELQRSQGLEADGRAGQRILKLLRERGG